MMPPDTAIEAASRWVDDEQDLMLGCECANPALQIERWGQEEARLQTVALWTRTSRDSVGPTGRSVLDPPRRLSAVLNVGNS